MSIWNKVFLGVIFVFAILTFFLGAFEFHVRNTGQKKIADLEKKITETDDKYARIDSGTAPGKLTSDKSESELGFDELRAMLRGRYDERGRAWFGCRVAGMEERTLPPALQQLEVMVTITGPFAPSATGAATDVVMPETLKGIVYVFEDKEEAGEGAGAFLGRFHVASEPQATKFVGDDGNEKNGWRIAFITADPVSEGEIAQISAASESRWALYLTPPIERIAEESDQPAEKSDDPEAAQDFSIQLDWLYLQRSNLNREIRIAGSDIEAYKTAKEKNDAENKNLEADCFLEEKRREAMDVQKKAVKTVIDQYQAEMSRIELLIEKLQTQIEVYVAEITNAQLQADEIIKERVKNAE